MWESNGAERESNGAERECSRNEIRKVHRVVGPSCTEPSDLHKNFDSHSEVNGKAIAAF